MKKFAKFLRIQWSFADTGFEKFLLVLLAICFLSLAGLIFVGIPTAIYQAHHESVLQHECESRNGDWGVVGWTWQDVNEGKILKYEAVDVMGCRPYGKDGEVK